MFNNNGSFNVVFIAGVHIQHTGGRGFSIAEEGPKATTLYRNVYRAYKAWRGGGINVDEGGTPETNTQQATKAKTSL